MQIAMRLLLSVAVFFGFTFVVVVGILSVVADLLAMTCHRPPSIFNNFSDEEPDPEDQESEAFSAGRRTARSM
jgi:hypothetical protein